MFLTIFNDNTSFVSFLFWNGANIHLCEITTRLFKLGPSQGLMRYSSQKPWLNGLHYERGQVQLLNEHFPWHQRPAEPFLMCTWGVQSEFPHMELTEPPDVPFTL